MSWISDVRSEMHRLKRTPKELQRFAFLVGSVLLLIGGAGLFKHWSVLVAAALWVGALMLLLGGWLNPQLLEKVYAVWMGMAFALGWVVSRAILILLFYLVITPIGIVARMFGKKFVDVAFRRGSESYWIPRRNSKKINYEKMF
jgi:hypothetical protein